STSILVPFSMRTGVNVQMEMFVGRKEEADRLCESADYSRLFSGRKLGKSALLRFIEATYDEKELPGGRQLRVLMAPAVGPSARELLHEVLKQMETRLAFRPKVDISGDPGDALVSAVEQFITTHPRINLLVILDEADSFVEAELEHYQKRRERC